MSGLKKNTNSKISNIPLKVKNIIGKKYGKLTVMSFVKVLNGDSRWLCKCDCGNMKELYGYNIKNGSTISCGCVSKKVVAETLRDMSLLGKTIGYLSVIEFAGKDSGNNLKWKVKCINCNKEKFVIAPNLKKKRPIQCSCIPRKYSKINYKDMSGKTFGYLKVLSFAGTNNKQDALWNVMCSNCGNKKIILGSSLRRNKNGVVSCGCLKESYVAIECKKYFKKKHNAICEYNELRNPKTNYFLPYDIFIPNKKIYIEIQGEQHKKFIKMWTSTKKEFEDLKRRDLLKKKHAEENGYYIAVDILKYRTPEKAISFIENILENIL